MEGFRIQIESDEYLEEQTKLGIRLLIANDWTKTRRGNKSAAGRHVIGFASR